MRYLAVLAGFLLTGCAVSTDVMDAGNGEYLISARASSVRGGAAGARQLAYKDATAYCAAKGGHAVVVGFGDAPASGAGSGPSAAASVNITAPNGAGGADLRFRCS